MEEENLEERWVSSKSDLIELIVGRTSNDLRSTIVPEGCESLCENP